MRLVTHSDDDDVLAGKKDPAYPDTSRHPSSYVDRALKLVKDEIGRALAHCPQCRSTHLRNGSEPAARSAVWRFTRCTDCGHVFDAELDR